MGPGPPTSSIDSLRRALEVANIDYVVIGAHAVSAWIEPRFTSDLDITIQADPADLERLEQALAVEGFTRARTSGEEQPSGPDFVRFSCAGAIDLEVQIAKTGFQRDTIARTHSQDGLRVATPEDLIVMKLIAYRPKDRADLAGLLALSDLDWAYIERWAKEWDVLDRLKAARENL
jgi:hypothetical protein